MNPNETPIEYSGKIEKWHGRFLPHWHVDGGIYFVTYGLRDAVPRHKVRELSNKRERAVAQLKWEGKLSPASLRVLDDELLKEMDRVLDQHVGQQLLREEVAAEIVSTAFEYFHSERYDLISWVIMPTHVHVALRALEDWKLSKIVGSWKSYTAKEIKKALGLSQVHVWHNDYYDRLMRTVEELNRVREYIWKNPGAAGLNDWGWREQYDFGVLW